MTAAECCRRTARLTGIVADNLGFLCRCRTMTAIDRESRGVNERVLSMIVTPIGESRCLNKHTVQATRETKQTLTVLNAR